MSSSMCWKERVLLRSVPSVVKLKKTSLSKALHGSLTVGSMRVRRFSGCWSSKCQNQRKRPGCCEEGRGYWSLIFLNPVFFEIRIYPQFPKVSGYIVSVSYTHLRAHETDSY